MSESSEISQLRLEAANAKEKNERLTRALLTARNEIEGLRDRINRIQKPPASVATLVDVYPDDQEVEVILGSRHMRLTTAPNFDFDGAITGELVRVDDQLVAVKTMGFVRSGVLASVLELVGNDRVLVGTDAGQEQLLRLAGPLRGGVLKPGDTVSIEPRTGFAYERLTRSHVEQLFAPEVPDVSYQDIGGLENQIEQVRDAIELPFRYPEVYREYGLRPPRGILLYGPPGCGKTLIAKAVASSLSDSERQTYFISIKGPELLNKFVGETERHIRSIFGRARDLAKSDVPVVIFFDEIEALFRTRGTGISSDVETMIVPQLLAEMDGVEALDNVVVIGASNRPDMIDPAVLRPGRLDVRVRIERPSRRQAKDIFSKYLTPDLPLSKSLVLREGSPEAAVKVMIETALDRLYSSNESTALFDLHLADGQKRRVFLADLVSGAMIAGTIERAKKRAIKEALTGENSGISTYHILAGVDEEIRESTDLAATTTPDEWARTVGLRGQEVLRVVPLGTNL